jgi:CHAD domain-containing protein
MAASRFTAPAPGDVARADLARVLDAVADHGRFVRDGAEILRRTLYDTFDWRLYAEGSVLEHQMASRVGPGGRWLVWRTLDGGEVLGRYELDEVPRLVGDLPPGPVTDRLAEVVEMRALLPLVTVEGSRTTLRMLDDEDKTVARVVVDDGVKVAVVGAAGAGAARSARRAAPRLAPTIEVVSVRGYDDEADELTDLLASQVVLEPAADDLDVIALRAAGHEPGGYTGKLRLSLSRDDTALEAWVTVLRALLDTIRVNEPGVRADLDPEFLHDYRVAVRRTRSVLGQAKHVLPATVRSRFADEFRWLGTITSPTRDFDVYVLEIPEFRAAVPAERRADLDPFEAFVVDRQRAAHAELVAQLDTPRYRTLLADWQAFLDDPSVDPSVDRSETSDAGRPAGEVAAERIWKAYRKVIRDGRRIDESSAPDELHTLRKDAKKLRYALECYGSLFDPAEVGAIVKELKGLQDVLGEYQDCQVQIGSLEGFGQEMLDAGDVPASSIIAIGFLVDQLDAREREARAAFDERFGRFDAKPVRERVRRQFRVGHGGHETEADTDTENGGGGG